MNGPTLQTLRQALGLTAESLAALSGVSLRSYRYWEAREDDVPADVEELVLGLVKMGENMIKEGLTLTDRLNAEFVTQGERVTIPITIYRDAANIREWPEGVPPSVHRAIMGRLASALIARGFDALLVWAD